MASQIARLAVVSRSFAVQQKKALLVPFRSMSGANPQIKASQEKFQADESTPIFLKGGPIDQVLYRTTVGLCIISVGMFVYNVGGLALKK